MKMCKIIIGRGEPGHFVLLVIDLKSKTLSCMDTLGGSAVRGRKYLTKWNKLIKKHMCTILNEETNFSYLKLDTPVQRDMSSCGVLVCRLGYNIMTGNSTTNVNTNYTSMSKYRKEIWRHWKITGITNVAVTVDRTMSREPQRSS